MRLQNVFGLVLSTTLLIAAGCATNSTDKTQAVGTTDQAQEESMASAPDSDFDPTALAGDWQGELSADGLSLPIIFHLQAPDTPGGVWEATMDSPDQGALGIPASEVSVESDKVRIAIAMINGAFEGTPSENGEEISGTWTQGDKSFSLDLQRQEAEQAAGPARPQEPSPPYPYEVEEVVFDGGRPTPGTTEEVRLAGTLTLPSGDGPFPAIVLLTGSGPQDRDETLVGHKPFWIIADFLSRHGVAVLRFDDRGVAESTGVFQDATIDEFTTDALAALDFLRSRDDIKTDAVGLLGHSEGANVAPQASLAEDKVDFMVMLAPTAVLGTELLARQNGLILEGSGMSSEGAKAYEENMLAALNKIVEVPLDEPLSEELLQELREDFQAAVEAMSPEDRRFYGPTEPAELEPVLDNMLAQLSMAWMRSFLALKPAETFRALNTPALALYGGKDLQVPAEQNEPKLKELIPESTDIKIVTLQNLNHLFQPATTGSPAEYAVIETTVDPEALQTILDWLVEHGWASAEASQDISETDSASSDADAP